MSSLGRVALTLRHPSFGSVVLPWSGNAGGVLDVTLVERSLSTSSSGSDGKSVGASVVVTASVGRGTATFQVVTADVLVVLTGLNVVIGNGADVVDRISLDTLLKSQRIG